MNHFFLVLLLAMSLQGCFLLKKNHVDGFREYKLGAAKGDILKMPICKSPIRLPSAPLDIYQCDDIDIDGKSYFVNMIFHDEKLVRIAVKLGGSDEEIAGKFFDGLVGQYGKAVNTDKLSFQLSIKNAKSARSLGFGKYEFSAGWLDDTIQLYTDGQFLFLFYQVKDFYELKNKGAGQVMRL